MRYEDLNPYVRFYNKRKSEKSYSKSLCAYDFRLFYVIEGSVTFELQNDSYKLSTGGVIIIPPGAPYRLIFDNKKAEYYVINFDFVSTKSHIQARVPVNGNCFDKNEIFSLDSIQPFEKTFVLYNAEVIENIFKKMQEIEYSETGEVTILNSALMKLAISQILKLNNTVFVKDEKHLLVEKIKIYIFENIEQSINNISVAKRFGYHPYYLNEIFLNAEKVTLHKYITDVKIKNIKRKLSLTNHSISSIALECGFKDSSYFSAFFRKATGITPAEYRKLLK